MATEEEPTKLELYLKLLGLILWPAIILIISCVFFTPLKLLVLKIPKAMDQTETVSIAGLTINFADQAIKKPSPRVNDALSELGKAPMKKLLELGVDVPDLSTYNGYAEEETETVKPLLNNGLIKIAPPFAVDSTNNQNIKYFRLTKLGLKSSLVLADLFNVFVLELSKPKLQTEKIEEQ